MAYITSFTSELVNTASTPKLNIYILSHFSRSLKYIVQVTVALTNGLIDFI